MIERIKCSVCNCILKVEYLGAHADKHDCLNCNYFIVEDGNFIFLEKSNIRLYSTGNIYQIPQYKEIIFLNKKINENNALEEINKIIDNLIFI